MYSTIFWFLLEHFPRVCHWTPIDVGSSRDSANRIHQSTDRISNTLRYRALVRFVWSYIMSHFSLYAYYNLLYNYYISYYIVVPTYIPTISPCFHMFPRSITQVCWLGATIPAAVRAPSPGSLSIPWRSPSWRKLALRWPGWWRLGAETERDRRISPIFDGLYWLYHP